MQRLSFLLARIWKQLVTEKSVNSTPTDLIFLDFFLSLLFGDKQFKMFSLLVHYFLLFTFYYSTTLRLDCIYLERACTESKL